VIIKRKSRLHYTEWRKLDVCGMLISVYRAIHTTICLTNQVEISSVMSWWMVISTINNMNISRNISKLKKSSLFSRANNKTIIEVWKGGWVTSIEGWRQKMKSSKKLFIEGLQWKIKQETVYRETRSRN